MVGVLGSPKGMQHILPAETPGNGQMPILAAAPFSDPPEQQCYLNDNQHIAALPTYSGGKTPPQKIVFTLSA
jgi:hypothetical protein